MRWMRALMVVMLAFSFLGLLLSFAIQNAYESKAERIQLVTIDRAHTDPLGPPTTDVGDPVRLMITDTHALLKNKTPLGLPMADRDYIRDHPGSALTLEQVLKVPNMARLGCLTAIILSIAGLILLSRVVKPEEFEV